ncbi:LysR family transcriptional regulator [Streptomyces sp. J2-1]|uniref:LysR family transcriptional regulator n=1 Tax=Streptomyces corallincola TaxID=2851888 RepID=UPI001C383E6C|nr:LysR family transcriptional regulator [Streptomyces corallincola]MBV2353957.1 LysR family transcriptional regulator [Streptomyces corallincola]
MELRHLKYFVAVADQHSFTRAAARCFVAQSALSQQIARLEKEVGSPLFSRSSRSVRLTAAGELLLPLARRILADVDNAQAALDALGGLRHGRLRLGLAQTAVSDLDMVEVMAEYHARHPGIHFSVTNAPSYEMAASVVAGELDLAVVGLGPRQLPEGLRHRLLGSDPLVAVVPHDHPLAGHREISLTELPADRPLIQFLQGSGLRRQVEAAFARAGVEAGQHFEIGRVSDMVRLAARGVGVTVVPRSSLGPSGPPEGARALRLDDEEAWHNLYVVYDEGRLAPAAAAFLDLLESPAAAGPGHHPSV